MTSAALLESRMVRSLLLRRELALVGVLAALFLFFGATTENFLDSFGLLEQSRYWVITGLLAVPMTFIISTAGIDLSVGATVALCGIVLGTLFQKVGMPIAVAAVLAIGAGFVCGAFNGGVSAYLGVPPLVVTLATMTLYRGAATGISQASPINRFPEPFQALSQADLFSFEWGESLLYFPVPLLFLLVAVVVGWLVLERSWFGRFTLAIGENETAANFAAIDTKRMKLALYTAAGAMAGVAALLNVALYNTAKSDAGIGLELEAIACVVLGGTRISGGQASIAGTLLGLVIIGILRHGLTLAGYRSQVGVIIVGVLLIATVVLNEWLARRRAGGRA